MPLPPPRYWEAPPEYDLFANFGEELPPDFDYASMLADPTGPRYDTGPQQHLSWAEYFADYFGYQPTPDGIKSAVWNTMDRTKYNPGMAQQAYDSVLYIDPDTGSQIAQGNPGDSLMEQGTLAAMESLGLRPTHLYGTPEFYTVDFRSGRQQITKTTFDSATGQWIESVVWEGNNPGGIHGGDQNVVMQQLAQQLGLTPEQLSEWQRTGFLALYPYPEGNAPGSEEVTELDEPTFGQSPAADAAGQDPSHYGIPYFQGQDSAPQGESILGPTPEENAAAKEAALEAAYGPPVWLGAPQQQPAPAQQPVPYDGYGAGFVNQPGPEDAPQEQAGVFPIGYDIYNPFNAPFQVGFNRDPRIGY